ncbi:MAG: hypothetical protein ACK53A_08520 [Gemmatimonadota bacterium]|nr:hypothetical protein [Gemmatimonadota bacterium]
MARYDVRLAAVALDVGYQWLDSLLARHPVAGVVAESQGVRRTVTDDALVTLAIVRDLHHDLGLPLGRAVAVAESLQASGAMRAGLVALTVDRSQVVDQLAPRVSEALERIVPRRRGRPPRPRD